MVVLRVVQCLGKEDPCVMFRAGANSLTFHVKHKLAPRGTFHAAIKFSVNLVGLGGFRRLTFPAFRGGVAHAITTNGTHQIDGGVFVIAQVSAQPVR